MKSCMYRIYEFVEEATTGIENAQQVISSQEELVEVLGEAKTKNDFSEFIAGAKENIEGIKKQIDTITIKSTLSKEIISLYEAGKAENASEEAKSTSALVDTIVTNLLVSLGVCSIEEVNEGN